MTPDDILHLAQRYAAAMQISLVTVGRRACGNDKIFVRLALGCGCNTRSIARAAAWFAANWPDDAAWPEDVPDPRAAPPAPGDERRAA